MSSDPRKKRVLFLCTGNSCRSQMAQGLLHEMAGDRYEAWSAGTHPQGINPTAVRSMREVGIDISGHSSDHVDDYVGRAVDVAITVCDHAAENCPVFPEATRRIHWNFDDPATAIGDEDERMPVFRRVRDEIRVALQGWLAATSD